MDFRDVPVSIGHLRYLKASKLFSLSFLKDIDGIGFVYLTESDVVRHKLVKDIIKAFSNDNFWKRNSHVYATQSIKVIALFRKGQPTSPCLLII